MDFPGSTNISGTWDLCRGLVATNMFTNSWVRLVTGGIQVQVLHILQVCANLLLMKFFVFSHPAEGARKIPPTDVSVRLLLSQGRMTRQCLLQALLQRLPQILQGLELNRRVLQLQHMLVSHQRVILARV